MIVAAAPAPFSARKSSVATAIYSQSVDARRIALSIKQELNNGETMKVDNHDYH